MPDYVVSARKYRPESFETLVGQDNIARTLKNAIIRGQLAHAYLFCGPRGVGKTSTARIFAKTINCQNPSSDMEPCGQCESCRSFAEGRSYCIHELDAASNNGVDDIKTLMDQVQIPPQVGKYSVYIIDEVHMLSQSAFNAFLKTLEEPPAHAIFILCTTEKHKILPTILSRCQTYDFNRISVPDMVSNLQGIAAKENIKIDDEALHVIARKADGAMRDALTLFDQCVAFCGNDIKCEDVLHNLGVLDYEYGFKMVDAALKGDYATALLTLDEVLSKGFNSQYFIASLGEHLRDLLVSRTGKLESLLDLPESLRGRYKQQAQMCSVKFIYDALSVTTACEASSKNASNQRLAIEFALMKLCFLQNAPLQSASQSAPMVSQQGVSQSAASAPAVQSAPEQASPNVSGHAPQTVPVQPSIPPVRPVVQSTPAQSSSNIAEPAPQAAPASQSAHPTPTPTAVPQSAAASPTAQAAPAPAQAIPASGPAAPEQSLNPVPQAETQSAFPESQASAPTSTGNAASIQETASPSASAANMSAASQNAPTASAPTTQEASDPALAAPAPQITPAPRSRVRKSASSLSLASMLNASEAKESKGEDVSLSDPLPSDDEIHAAWKKLPEAYAGKPRLVSAIANARLILGEKNGVRVVEFQLISEAQCDWIREKMLPSMEKELRGLLSSSRVKLNPGVLPAEKVEKVIYMNADKAKALMQESPEFAGLVKDLELDTA